MSYVLEFSDQALEDIENHKKAGDHSVLKKLQRLLNELQEHPMTGAGQPEKLKHDLVGLFSRRINRKHSLVYSINEEVVTVYVVSAWSHYADK